MTKTFNINHDYITIDGFEMTAANDGHMMTITGSYCEVVYRKFNPPFSLDGNLSPRLANRQTVNRVTFRQASLFFKKS